MSWEIRIRGEEVDLWVVLVIDRWETFLDHVDQSKGIGLYQIKNVGDGYLLRVRAGTLGYEEKYPKENEDLLEGRIKVLVAKGLIKVVRVVADEAWFS